MLGVCLAEEPVLPRLAAAGVRVRAVDWRCTALRRAVEGGLPPEAVQSWNGAHAAIPGGFDAALVDLAHLPGRAAFTLAVRGAVAGLRAGGRLLVRGGNGEGIGGAATRLREWLGAVDTLALGGGGRILAAVRPAGVPPPPAPQREPAALWRGLRLTAAPGVFARGLPDAATTLLVETVAAELASGAPPARACDLGCGGGAVGLALLRLGVGRCAFVDDSVLAVEAAAANLAANGLADRGRCVAADAATGVPDAPYPLVVCNPPFHEGPREDRGVGRAIARAAWSAASGRLYVVGQRFLRYERVVPELTEVARSGGFRVLRADRGQRPPARAPSGGDVGT